MSPHSHGRNFVKLDSQSGGVILSDDARRTAYLHPLWLRERITDPHLFDPLSQQRLYEYTDIPLDLKVVDANVSAHSTLRVKFSDGHKADLSIKGLREELQWEPSPETPPLPKAWTSGLKRPDTRWDDLDAPETLKTMLTDFLTYGFCIIQDTPTQRDSLLKLAGRFGFVRDTHWGMLFNVEKKPVATDIAYTDAALTAHTDNPYREPVPGLQFLHCLENEVSGGLSTLADGIAIAAQLAQESPEQASVLERVAVRFRYDGVGAILENFGPIIQRDHAGIVRRIRLSPRLDYVPALDPETLDLFYAGRRRLIELANSSDYQISFPFKKGTLLMMDNYRLLHGRTAFKGSEGRRHLQGCYTDHDGVTSLYRMLARDGKTTSITRDKNI